MKEYNDHIVSSFDEDIESIRRSIIKMATLCEEQYKLLYHIVDTGSASTVEDVLKNEPILDQCDEKIRDQVITFITLRSPMAVDLREGLAALKISTDLERLGDYCKNVSLRIQALEEIPAAKVKSEILRMIVMVQGQLKKVIDAYVSKNKDKSIEIRNDDALIDKLYQSVYEQIIEEIRHKPNKLKTLMNTKLLFTIKTIERAGDHITNIAEEVYYASVGETIKTPRPKGEFEQ